MEKIQQELEEVSPDLLRKVLSALGEYARLDEPGASLQVVRAGEDGDHVRVYRGAEHYQHAKRDQHSESDPP